MHILIVTNAYPGRHRPNNGVFIAEQARALAAEGHEVTVIAGRHFRGDPRTEEEAGVRLRRFSYLSSERLLGEYRRLPVLRMITFVVGGVIAVARAARSVGADVIHAHWLVPSGLVALVGARLAGYPVVVTAHGTDVAMARRSGFVRWVSRFVVAHADALVAVSQATADDLSAMGVLNPSTKVIPMGVDTSAFTPGSRSAARSELRIEPDARVALFVGSLSESKGVADLIKAFAQVQAVVANAKLVLVGDGPLLPRVPELCSEVGIPDGAVLTPGRVDHDSVRSWMNAADLVVLSSYSEGMPVCLMEAAAMGVPVVASDVGGSAEIVRLSPASRLVTPGDVEAIAEALTAVLQLGAPDVRPSVIGHNSPLDAAAARGALLRPYREMRPRPSPRP